MNQIHKVVGKIPTTYFLFIEEDCDEVLYRYGQSR
jgi:hypothetical protein